MNPTLRQRLLAIPPFVWLLLLLLAWVVMVALSLVLGGSGFLHPESYSFLPHYLSGRPLLELIYDNRVTDWGNYQARELGFVFDWLDCQFIAWCESRGYPHWVSISHYLLFLLAGLALWRIATNYLALSRIAAFGLVLLLWTCPTAILYSSFYRAAKVGLLTASLLTIWAWLGASREDASWPRLRVLSFGILAASLPMFDKQGLIFLAGFLLFLGSNVFFSPSPRTRQLFVAGLVAAVFAWTYQRFIGPALTYHLLGYEVNRGYASIPFRELATHPKFLGNVVFGALLFTLDSFRIPLGNLPVGLALLAGAGIWRVLPGALAGQSSWRSSRWLFAGLALLIAGVFAAMLMVFPMMFSNEHRRLFYPLPVAAFWFVVVAAALAEAVRRWPRHAQWVEIGLFALVLGNLFALQDHRFLFRHGKYQPYIENAARVRSALLPANLRLAGVDPAEAAALLAAAPYFRDAVPPSLREDRIFLLFLSRHASTP